MTSRRPTPFEILAAILASVPEEIAYSGSDEWKIEGFRDLRSPEADGGEPFAVELRIEGFAEPYVLVLTDTKDVVISDLAPDFYREISFEVEDPQEETERCDVCYKPLNGEATVTKDEGGTYRTHDACAPLV